MLRLLKPSPDELARFAELETRPENYDRFLPVTSGPAASLAVLSFVAVAAVFVLPVRLAIKVLSGRGR